MAHQKKKKIVSHDKYNNVDAMSYFELKHAFDTLHHEAKESFQRLASNKRIFKYLEKKVSDSEKELETLKESMIKSIKDTSVVDKGPWFKWGGCETCHIWQKEVKTLKAKLDKASQPKITYAIDQLHFKNSMINPYQRYTYVIKDQSSKCDDYSNSRCLYCCKMGHTIKNVALGGSWFPKAFLN